MFVSKLANEGLRHCTIKVYLSAVRYCSSMSDLFRGVAMPQLDYVMQGIKKHQASLGRKERPRLPITPGTLRRLKTVWDASAEDSDTRMLWAACCLAFCAFLRIGEMTAPGEREFDPDVHLSFRDVAIDDLNQPTLMQVTIKQSKTDHFAVASTCSWGEQEPTCAQWQPCWDT